MRRRACAPLRGLAEGGTARACAGSLAQVVLANDQPVPALLVANKIDLEEAPLDSARLDAFCAEYGFFGWRATSAKANTGVDEAVRDVVREILRVRACSGAPTRTLLARPDCCPRRECARFPHPVAPSRPLAVMSSASMQTRRSHRPTARHGALPTAARRARLMPSAPPRPPCAQPGWLSQCCG